MFNKCLRVYGAQRESSPSFTVFANIYGVNIPNVLVSNYQCDITELGKKWVQLALIGKEQVWVGSSRTVIIDNVSLIGTHGKNGGYKIRNTVL